MTLAISDLVVDKAGRWTVISALFLVRYAPNMHFWTASMRQRFPGLRSALSISVAVALIVQTVIGTVWWALNLNSIPKYGDTQEYIHLAATLQVDSYRTLAYPVVVKLGIAFQSRTGLSWWLPIYFLQTTVAAWAAWYLVGTILPKLRRRPRIFFSAAVLTFPLTLHYTVTILTDSLATSFFILSICSLARMTSPIRNGKIPWIVALIGTVGTVMLRQEKFYIILILVTMCILYLLFHNRASRRAPGTLHFSALASLIGVLVVIFVLPAFAVNAFNHSTQTSNNLGRSPATVASALYDRIVWTHVEEIRGQLPPSVQATLPPTTIVPDKGVVLTALRAAGGGSDEQTIKAVWHTLDCCGLSVAEESGVDIAKSFGAPVTLFVDWIRDRGGATPWNLSRMSEARPSLSMAYLLWSAVLTLLVIVATLYNLLTMRNRQLISFSPVATLSILIGGVLLNAIFFGLITSLDVNLRYALTNYVMMIALPLCLVLAPLNYHGPAGQIGADPEVQTRKHSEIR